jgi:hypothetical protein
MLYEQIVNIEPARCIRLSEALEQSEESIESMERYLTEFRELKDLLAKAHYPLKKQPLFVWHDRNSSSWCFEEQRILHSLHMMLMAEAKSQFDKCEYKEAKVTLSRAVDVCKDMLKDWVKTPYIRGMPELQPAYNLALLFRTKGTYCFNMHMFKSTPLVAKMAYKYVEISNALWKKGESKEYETKLKAHYHHAVASDMAEREESDTFNFKQLISHSAEAVRIYQDAKMQEDHDVWSRRNDTVHYETVEPVDVPLFTVEQALKNI